MCPVWNVLNQRMRIQLKAQRASCSLAASSTRKSNISPLDSDWWVERSIHRKYHQCSQFLILILNLYLSFYIPRGYRRTSQSFPHPYKEMPSISNRYVLPFGISDFCGISGEMLLCSSVFFCTIKKLTVTYYVFAFKSKISRLPAYLTVQMVRFFYKEKESVNAKVLKVGLLLRSDLVYKVLSPKYI